MIGNIPCNKASISCGLKSDSGNTGAEQVVFKDMVNPFINFEKDGIE